MYLKRLAYIALATAGILLIPLVAIQFTSEVACSLSDFVIMGIMLFGTGVLLDLVARKVGKYRALATLLIVIAFQWLWAELAVGVFTNWGS